ncbi:MAG TPA: putative Ig domain-containing protein [Actinocatenispora sp.]
MGTPLRRALATTFVAFSATALASVGLAQSAWAAPASATTTGSSSVERVCAQPDAPHVMSCLALRQAGIHPDLPSGYGPTDLQSAYQLPANGGAGQTIAIVDAYDDPSAATDLAAYRSAYGLPALTSGQFKKVNQNGQTSPLPSGDTGWAGEISLDLDMVSAVAPKANIILVEADSATDADLYQAEDEAVTLGAKFVSNSWGGSESSSQTSDDAHFNHPGVAITVSSGDSDYGAEYPATSKYVTAVGGTSLSRDSSSRGWSEKVWKTNSTEGTGSGCSAYDAKPTWQTVTTNCSKRAEADVSAVADPATGVAVYQTYGGSGWAVYGGTSASAPIVAGIYALAGTPGASDYPASYPYSHQSNLNDVTSGNNGSCSTTVWCTAGAGWDGPTGLGTPAGTAAFAAGGSSGSVSVANPGNQSNKTGDSVSLQLSASGGTSPYTWSATGLPAGLSISSAGKITGSPTANGTYSVTATAKDAAGKTGSASFSWTIGSSGGTCTAGQLLGNPGFETGSAAPWSASTGVVSSTADGGVAHGGSYYAWLDGYGTTHTDTLSQSVTVPSGCTSVTFSFYLYVDTEESGSTAYDKLTVKANSTTVATFSNASTTGSYIKHTYTLSGAAGSTVTLSFSGTEDSTLATSFLIDDAAVTVS